MVGSNEKNEESFVSIDSSQINELKKCSIRLYSVSWLIDSFWHKDTRCVTAMDRIYYTTK